MCNCMNEEYFNYADEDEDADLLYANATINPLPETATGEVAGCVPTDYGWQCSGGAQPPRSSVGGYQSPSQYGASNYNGYSTRQSGYTPPVTSRFQSSGGYQAAPPPRGMGQQVVPQNAMVLSSQQTGGAPITVVPASYNQQTAYPQTQQNYQQYLAMQQQYGYGQQYGQYPQGYDATALTNILNALFGY